MVITIHIQFKRILKFNGTKVNELATQENM